MRPTTFLTTFVLPALSSLPFTSAWLPTKDASTIRGVNLGGLFVIEPWLQHVTWQNMKCGSQKSEFDCVMSLGQSQADKTFANHWKTWITEADLKEMVSYGINTVRIPVGYWMLEDLVYRDSEYFPKGGYPYLEKICKAAKKLGLYVILDLHGAPGAQIDKNAFTGQFAPTPGFYQDYQYTRAVTFLGWITRKIHSKPEVFGSVGMLQVLNEPLAWHPDVTATLVSEFYPKAWKRIRYVERELKVKKSKQLHVMFMDEMWGSGNPNQAIKEGSELMSYDYHKYVKWDTSVTPTRESYMTYSCTADLGCKKPLIVGEWSLSVPDNMQESEMFKTSGADAVEWFGKWFVAQQQMYERSGLGWVFWNWKTELGDWRWGYRDAVRAGVIPKNLRESVKWNVCGAYKKDKRETVETVEAVEVKAEVKRGVEEVVKVPAVEEVHVQAEEPKPSGVRKSHLARHKSLRRTHAHLVGPSS
ncbi:hypothetical protein AOL_s00043g294 [Orbilia oligospora ATCC 24927]|uniref:glucan 1,3-beta-glucosidase n=1 Tax=Arthrobotrys oligospora (strain ATCC 24927 / CBS 115.81 / DSM 1491) TaxID=756982 RepID=G1X3M1_ARTOA|nr:hypothetical protein AOL_s00043g294 [Orbilia oligospora ATCC 24927]EGX52505.1 hypothetical protein AOL_s00043g294 [Orbilia oligospora ATCC 24927]